MLELKQVIIDRIDDIKSISNKARTIIQNQHNGNLLDSELQVNRLIIKLFSVLKKREKQRGIRQNDLLEEVKSLRFWQNKVIENFYSVSLDIFSRYDPSFFTLLEGGQSTTEKLKNIYTNFFQKQHQKVSASHLLSVVRGQIIESNPFVLLGWVCEWSKNELRREIKLGMCQQFDRHEQQMRKITTSKSTLINIPKQKIPNPLSNSQHVHKSYENTQPIVLTNKQSVYALFLDELTQYYKWLPLDLDTGLVKGIKKIHGRENQLEREESLLKAANILIESKNKHINEDIELYRQHYQDKYSQRLKIRQEEIQISLTQLPKRTENKPKKSLVSNYRFFERIKSESKDQQQEKQKKLADSGRNSLLLWPKTKEVSFQNSRDLIKRINKEREGSQLQLPGIMENRLVSIHSKSSAPTKHIRSFILNQSRKGTGTQQKSFQKIHGEVNQKAYEFRQIYLMQRYMRKNNYSCINKTKLEINDNPELKLKQLDSDVSRRNCNRKLMLQLLREKNKQTFLGK